jgi:DNA (cytosine-5)-methyltransferase 1
MVAAVPLGYRQADPSLRVVGRRMTGLADQNPSSRRRRLLDLFCGAGGAATGYYRAGFDIVGVDIRPQPNYPFEFVQDDALGVLSDPDSWLKTKRGVQYFDAIHASPPCQLFSAYQRANKRQGEHQNLIPVTRELLEGTRLPYVIENVPGAPLKDPITVCGVSAGLQVRRHRLFESNVSLMAPPCACGGWQPARFDRGSRHIRPNDRRTVAVGEWRIPLSIQEKAMGIDWMTMPELSQAIPPAYTELIGHQLMQHVKAVA